MNKSRSFVYKKIVLHVVVTVIYRCDDEQEDVVLKGRLLSVYWVVEFSARVSMWPAWVSRALAMTCVTGWMLVCEY